LLDSWPLTTHTAVVHEEGQVEAIEMTVNTKVSIERRKKRKGGRREGTEEQRG